MEISIHVYVKSDNNGKRKSYVKIESKHFLAVKTHNKISLYIKRSLTAL